MMMENVLNVIMDIQLLLKVYAKNCPLIAIQQMIMESVPSVIMDSILTKAENVKLFLLTALPLIFTENVHNVRPVTTWTKDAPVYPTTVEKPTALENALNV